MGKYNKKVTVILVEAFLHRHKQSRKIKQELRSLTVSHMTEFKLQSKLNSSWPWIHESSQWKIEDYRIIWGSFRIMGDHLGSWRIIQDHAGSCRNIHDLAVITWWILNKINKSIMQDQQEHAGLLGDHARSYKIMQNHAGSFSILKVSVPTEFWFNSNHINISIMWSSSQRNFQTNCQTQIKSESHPQIGTKTIE